MSITPVDAALTLKAGLALVPLEQGVVKVSGPDRLSWLTTLSSQLLAAPLAQKNFYNPSGRPVGAETVTAEELRKESESATLGGIDPEAAASADPSQMSFQINKEALILDANGHIRFYLRVYDDGENCFLICAQAQALADFLKRMQFMLRVEVEVLSDLRVYGAYGLRQELRIPLAAVAEFTWYDPWPGVCAGGTAYSRKDLPHPGADYRGEYWVFSPAQLEAVRQILQDFSASDFFPYFNEDGYRVKAMPLAAKEDLLPEPELFELAWEASRIEAGRPGEKEIDERALPHELDWLRTAVHLNKGCYPGQETVARVVNLGRPPRRIVRLEVDGAANLTPPQNCGIFLEGKQIGKMTSFAVDHEEGPIALGLVKRTAKTEPSAEKELYLSWSDQEENYRLEVKATELVTSIGRAWDSPAERPGAGIMRL